MKVLVVTTEKGGAGKTTTSCHLGVELVSRDYRVVLVDTDSTHAALTDWWNDRQAPEPQLLAVAFEDLAAALEVLRADGVDFVVIDTPPVVNKAVKAVVEMADLAIIPSKASKQDLRGTTKTLALIGKTKTPMIFVLNETKAGTVLERDAIIALSQHGKLGPITHSRQEFASSMVDGRTAGELGSNTAAREVSKLADYVLEQVGMHLRKGAVKQPRKQALTQLSSCAVAQGDKQ